MATKHLVRRTVATALSAYALLALAACGGGGSDGATGPAGPAGPPGPGQPVVIGLYDPLPGVNAVVTGLTGGTGSGGAFAPGNTVTVLYTLKDNAGTDVNPTDYDYAAAYVSGPTSNYQRVIVPQTNLGTASTWVGGGVWSYTFPVAIPGTYLPPINDTASFTDGELTGQTLLAGTYSVGLEFHKVYTVEGKDFTDAAGDVFDFQIGAGSVVPRRVVQRDNCNVCHTSIRAHDGTRKDVRLCVLCHTAGAEDSNVASATPGVTIEFKVMIHRLHNGTHLPSVNGVSTDSAGNRLYPTGTAGSASTTVVNFPKPLVFADDAGGLADFSEVMFPVFPNFNIAMPKDLGYSALGSATPAIPVGYAGPLLRTQKACEDTVRLGVTMCLKCHGDPDAAGPLTAPAQGLNYANVLSQRACGSCHDDIDWAKPYTANGQTMAASLADGSCTSCHTDTGANQPTSNYKSLSVVDAHLHPLNDAAVDAGVNCVVTAVTGGTGTSGKFLNGDAPSVTFTLKNDVGTDIGLAALDSCSAFFLGATTNRQLVMPLTSANGMSLNPFDFTGRLQAISSSNKGTMGKVFLGTPAVAETLVVEFSSAVAFGVTGTSSGSLGTGTLLVSSSTSPSGASVANWDLSGIATTEQLTIAFSSSTAFSVTGSVSGALGSGTLPAAKSASMRFVSPKVSFNLTVGTTSFAAGNQFVAVLFHGGAANPVTFALVAGTTPFSSTAGAPDRFYYEVVPNAPTYSVNIPMDMQLEFLGDGNGAIGQVLTAGNLPVYYGRQQLWTATAGAPTTTTSAAVNLLARQVDIAPIAGFAAGDTVVVDPLGGVGVREYTTITPAKADGTGAASGDTTTRLYFRTPLRYAHGSVTISKVTLALKQEGAANAYTLNPATGAVTTVVAVPLATPLVMTYRTTSKFGYKRHAGDTLQAYYVPPANDTVAIGQEQGDWQGLPYLSGTYTADIWFYRNLDVGIQNELQTYRSTSYAGAKDFLFGSATTIEPRAVISTSENCYTCHNDVMFHGGGRRGVDACLTCHGTSGSTSNVLAPTSAPIEFRQMLHKIHMGADLPDAATYPFATDGAFPAMPGGMQQCVRCHGNDAWKEPAPRSHPNATVPVRVWGVICGSCHSSATSAAHINSNTVAGSGIESCVVCHGPDKVMDVAKVHTAK